MPVVSFLQWRAAQSQCSGRLFCSSRCVISFDRRRVTKRFLGLEDLRIDEVSIIRAASMDIHLNISLAGQHLPIPMLSVCMERRIVSTEGWTLKAYVFSAFVFSEHLTKYRDLNLNPGNLNAWLTHQDCSKVSLNTARKTLNYLRQYNAPWAAEYNWLYGYRHAFISMLKYLQKITQGQIFIWIFVKK